MSNTQDRDPDLKVSLGRHNEFVIRNRFGTASISVDIAISVVFIAGSCCDRLFGSSVVTIW